MSITERWLARAVPTEVPCTSSAFLRISSLLASSMALARSTALRWSASDSWIANWLRHIGMVMSRTAANFSISWIALAWIRRIIGRVCSAACCSTCVVGHALVDQARGVELAAAGARSRILHPGQRGQLLFQFGDATRPAATDAEFAAFVQHQRACIWSLLAHALLLHLLGLRTRRPSAGRSACGRAVLLHQLAPRSPSACRSTGRGSAACCVRKTVEVEAARDPHHLAELVAGGIEVGVAHLVQQLHQRTR